MIHHRETRKSDYHTVVKQGEDFIIYIQSGLIKSIVKLCILRWAGLVCILLVRLNLYPVYVQMDKGEIKQ